MAELSKEEEALELIDKMALKGQDNELDLLRQNIQNGKSSYDYITSAQQGIAEVLFTLAFALNGSENDQTSLLYARLAQSLRPNNAETILLTSELLRDQKQFDLAIENYETISKDNSLYLSAEIPYNYLNMYQKNIHSRERRIAFECESVLGTMVRDSWSHIFTPAVP